MGLVLDLTKSVRDSCGTIVVSIRQLCCAVMICTVDQQVKYLRYVTAGGYAHAANTECVRERIAAQISIRQEWSRFAVTVTLLEYWTPVSDSIACDYLQAFGYVR